MRAFKSDLHIHSCLSPCAELDMSPKAIVERSLEQGLDIIGDNSSQQYKKLKEIRDLYAFFDNEWPALLERWEKKHSKS